MKRPMIIAGIILILTLVGGIEQFRKYREARAQMKNPMSVSRRQNEPKRVSERGLHGQFRMDLTTVLTRK